ncbi:VWA domain-containing protein [Shinella daejeonensis]|uniref:vWA domain-containing protein n=1 Tax=Shinella daejeonensis TaxID=659017 RepID=UPI0020C7AB9B|nr:pilus assembly protein [Shinella daejeonensis]MCP8895152.1 VWA domain-containing protein [Shinella daejeonensis]
MTKTQGRKPAARFLGDRGGNFAMMTAIVFPVMLAAGGVAIDLSNMVMTKAELQDATDSAALAAASAMANDGFTAAEAKLVALSFLRTQMGGSIAPAADGKEKDENDLNSTQPVIDIQEIATVGTGKSFQIRISMERTVQFNAFTRLLGQESTTLNATSSAESATESKNALSMYLVLDKSGSMLANTNERNRSASSCIQYDTSGRQIGKKAISPCYIKKIEALKLASANLFTQLNIADPNTQFVRLGTVSYNSSMSTAYQLTWGTTDPLRQVNNLSAGGGTSSTGAMNEAYNKLSADTENNEHKKKNGQVPTKYIVLMTDGDNNDTSDDTKTKKVCATAKAAGMEIFGVAFMAPSRGQRLLQDCVTSPENYFSAEKMDDLIDAFKTIGERTSAVVSRLTH